MYITVKCFELRICSFYENSKFKKCNSFEHLIRVSETGKAIVEIILFSVRRTSKFINTKILYIKLGKERHTVIPRK